VLTTTGLGQVHLFGIYRTRLKPNKWYESLLDESGPVPAIAIYNIDIQNIGEASGILSWK